jgi:Tfp pilus assembly protein PilE
MATKHKPSSSRVLFLELILDLVIFAICAVICLQVFAEAKREADRSEAITQLGIEAQEVGELFKSGRSDAASLAERTYANSEGDTLTWYYDQKLNIVPSDKAYFVMTCVIDTSQPVKAATITLIERTRAELGDRVPEELFKYDIRSYQPKGGGAS